MHAGEGVPGPRENLIEPGPPTGVLPFPSPGEGLGSGPAPRQLSGEGAPSRRSSVLDHKKCTEPVATSSGFPTDRRRSDCHLESHQPQTLRTRCIAHSRGRATGGQGSTRRNSSQFADRRMSTPEFGAHDGSGGFRRRPGFSGPGRASPGAGGRADAATRRPHGGRRRGRRGRCEARLPSGRRTGTTRPA
jgi:hypothetical protein